MKLTFWLFIAVVFLFGAAVVHCGNGGNGHDVGTLQSINCSDASSISFSINIPDVAEWKDYRSPWSLNNQTDLACEPTFNQSLNLATYSGFDASTCHPGEPATTHGNSTFKYKFEISVTAGASGAIAPVTFAYDHSYVVECFYNRRQENIMASFRTGHSLSGNDSAVEDFIIEFTLHEAANDKEVTSVIDLKTAVYGKLEIVGNDNFPQGLDIHLRKVTADTNLTPGGDELELISDGCAASDVVTDTSCDGDEDERFDFDIFRFPGQTTGDLVYLRAKVIVCLTNNSASVCRSECTSCSSRRKRRETLEEIQRTEFYVTAGPFQIRDPDEESETAAGKGDGTALPTYMIAVVAVCGLLAVAIVSAVVLIVFRRRLQNVGKAELPNEDSVIANHRRPLFEAETAELT